MCYIFKLAHLKPLFFPPIFHVVSFLSDRGSTACCRWGWTACVGCTEPRSSQLSSSSASLRGVHANWGQSCSSPAGGRSSCWRVRGARSPCWTSCRVCITAWLQTPGVTPPPWWPTCAPSSGGSRRRSSGWSLTCFEEEDEGVFVNMIKCYILKEYKQALQEILL